MTFDFASARQNMVDCQVRTADVTDRTIQDAMLAVARERLVPADNAALALGGRLGVVERNGPVGKAKLYVNADTGIGGREVFDATPPMLPGFERVQQFAF